MDAIKSYVNDREIKATDEFSNCSNCELSDNHKKARVDMSTLPAHFYCPECGIEYKD